MATEAMSHLSSTPTFEGLDPAILGELLQSGEIRELHDGDILFTRGNPYSHEIYLLLEGHVRLDKTEGDSLIYHAGDFIGLSNYLDQSPYRGTATALDTVRILAIPEKRLQQLEQRYPEFANRLDHLIGQRLRNRLSKQRIVIGTLAQPVASVMTTPLAHCDEQTTILAAYKIMQSRKIGSLAVFDSQQRLLGMLTFAGLCEALLLKGAEATSPVGEAACETPVTIGIEDPLWQAEQKLHHYHVKYLVVMQDNQPVGLVSQTDLFKLHAVQQHDIHTQITQADSHALLRKIFSDLPAIARELYEHNHLASQAVLQLSNIHLALQRRCVELTLAELQEAGLGSAPRNYALLVMGSGGRREMLLNPDQDNGLIIDDTGGPLQKGETDWFMEFAKRLNTNLDVVGYILCPGGIMARNPLFHKTLHQWQDQISQMVTFPSNKKARWANIVFDFATLYGDNTLTRRLREHLLQELASNPTLLSYMVEDDAEGRPAVGFFNQFLTSHDAHHKGKIDLKRNGLRLVADAARIYALHARLHETNTRMRLKALVHQGILNRDLVDSVLDAFEELLDLLLMHQIQQREQDMPPDKFIDPNELSWQTRAVLRASMRAIKRLQDQLQGEFGRSVF